MNLIYYYGVLKMPNPNVSNLTDEEFSVVQRLNRFVESLTGCKISDIYNTPVDKWRKQVELKHNNVSMSFTSKFPYIGRGNVLSNHTISHAQIEKSCEDIWEK